MADVVLATLNARYIHASLGLRYLYANLGELAERATMREFIIKQAPQDIAEQLLAEEPQIVALGIYVWNVEQSHQLVRLLKTLRPELTIVLGGPQVSYEAEAQAIVAAADYVVQGEGDVAFAELCQAILEQRAPTSKIIGAQPLDLAGLKLPYRLYSDDDIQHRVLYVEASRGCPFRCEFCLSALDKGTRAFAIDAFLAEMAALIERGARQFKFVDRTFNLDIATSTKILDFFLERPESDFFLHFEMIPDRLPVELRSKIAQFEPGSLQFEIGIQSFNDEVNKRISRRQKTDVISDNFEFLRANGVHIHADLIAGLPGETLASFASGFDRLVALKPQEIQLGILKRLGGAPIIRHDDDWAMSYADVPPYDVISTSTLSFQDLQRLKRFARYWDLVANSGNFESLICELADNSGSLFWGFWDFSDWLFRTLETTWGIALDRLAQALFSYLHEHRHLSEEAVAGKLCWEYRRLGRKLPRFLRPYQKAFPVEPKLEKGVQPARQARHS